MNQILQNNGKEWGCLSIIEDDSRIFGFNVGYLSVKDIPPARRAAGDFYDWVQSFNVIVTSAAIPATDLSALKATQDLGFVFVDASLQVSLFNLKRRPKTIQPAGVRIAQQSDNYGIEKIAATAFNFGRYHRDVRFPKSLANRRFQYWIRDTLKEKTTEKQFFVFGNPGQPEAFMLVEVRDGRAQWHLGGVSREITNGLLGPMFFAGVLESLESVGVKSVVAKISAANTPVLNIYSALGFQAAKPEFTMHYHNRSAQLLSL